MKMIGTKIPEELSEKFDAYCILHKTTVSAALRELIEMAVNHGLTVVHQINAAKFADEMQKLAEAKRQQQKQNAFAKPEPKPIVEDDEPSFTSPVDFHALSAMDELTEIANAAEPTDLDQQWEELLSACQGETVNFKDFVLEQGLSRDEILSFIDYLSKNDLRAVHLNRSNNNQIVSFKVLHNL